MAHDDGFNYRSQMLNENLNLPKIDSDIELDEEGYDGLKGKVNIDDSVKVASYMLTSGMGTSHLLVSGLFMRMKTDN